MTPTPTKPATEAEKPQEELVTITIDKNKYDGGFRTNDKLYVGTLKVTKAIADDLARRMEEIDEIQAAQVNPKQAKIRLKNFEVIANKYLADPGENRLKPGWSEEFGMLDPWQWDKALTPQAQQMLKRQRFEMYGI